MCTRTCISYEVHARSLRCKITGEILLSGSQGCSHYHPLSLSELKVWYGGVLSAIGRPCMGVLYCVGVCVSVSQHFLLCVVRPWEWALCVCRGPCKWMLAQWLVGQDSSSHALNTSSCPNWLVGHPLVLPLLRQWLSYPANQEHLTF